MGDGQALMEGRGEEGRVGAGVGQSPPQVLGAIQEAAGYGSSTGFRKVLCSPESAHPYHLAAPGLWTRPTAVQPWGPAGPKCITSCGRARLERSRLCTPGLKPGRDKHAQGSQTSL